MTTKPNTEFDLNLHTFRLLRAEPFFAALSRRINKMETTAIPTAGVCLNKHTAQFEMVYNPTFMASLTDTQKTGVLMHEFYHIIYGHVTDRLPEGGMSKLWNIATDLAINSHIYDKLPENALVPAKAGTPFEGYPMGKASEWYYAKLQQDKENGEGAFDPKHKPEDGDGDGEGGQGQGGEPQEGEGSGGGGGDMDSLDDHSGWGDADDETKAMAKERLKQAMQDATKEVQNSGQGWGSVSADMRKKIMDMITPKVNWRKVLRYFIKTSQRSSKRSTVRRINKRFPYIHAGKRVNRTANIAISIDQSGSVSDAMLASFFSELGALAQYATFTVIPFDTRVDDSLVYEWKKGQRKTWDRVMCGGTCFDAPTKYVNDRSFDGHIILTDLCAPKPKASKCQRMWMASPDDCARPYFKTNERIIAIDS
jgi:predicted metal-dependent peptidase